MKKAVHNHKHISLDDRLIIQSGIVNYSSLSSIASIIGKDPTTVKKEIVLHRSFKIGRHYNQEPAFSCLSFKACSSPHYNNFSFCNSSCSDYKPSFCKRRDKSPFACNGCDSLKSCRKDKFIYDAKVAHSDYISSLHDSRSGVNLSFFHARDISNIVKPLLDKGQSPAQILIGHPELPFCKKTFYTYVDNGILPNINNSDFRKKVTYKPRKKSSVVKPLKDYLIGHTYNDFASFLDRNPFAHIVELDSVVGVENNAGKILHTMLFVDQNFLLAYLSDANTAISTVHWFDELQKKLTTVPFIEYFFLVLTDRGSEFSSVKDLEFDQNNIQRSHVFYCDAMHSWDKGALENVHHYLRYFLPKGTSFSDLTQDKVDLMISHINSSPRLSLKGKTPYECMEFFYGEFLMKKLNIKKIPKDDVILKPYLIK